MNLEKEERELTDEESARRLLRSAIRETAARTVGVIVARPFTGLLSACALGVTHFIR